MDTPDLDTDACTRAMRARDPRFDGRFFIAVRTTGVFCRPICAVRTPKPANVRFFRSSAAALEAGFRPCLRCRPESAPGTPAWGLTSTTVARALRLIDAGALDGGSLEALAARLGVGTRHLSRLFQRHLGASPKAIAQARRLHFAKKLIDETALPLTQIAFAAGYGSLRRFNDHFLGVYARAPSLLRRGAGTRGEGGGSVEIALGFRQPFDWDATLAFLAKRAVPGVEWAAGGRWHRNIETPGGSGHITVRPRAGANLLDCRLDLPTLQPLHGLVERLRAVFDLDADPAEIHAVLGRDPLLASRIERQPGLRVPLAWDPFETAVRAIVGQQISVAGATTVMGRIAAALAPADPAAPRVFPAPARIATADPALFPMPRARAGAIIGLARAVADGTIELGRWADPAALREKLLAIDGIGPWTADYIAMRVLGDPDAFLHTDLVLRRVAEREWGDRSAAALLARAEAWRPWRAYAGMYLWQAAADAAGGG